MAGGAALVDRRASLQQPDVTAAVNVVARRALHRAFAYRPVAEPVVLVDDRLVTGGARFHLRALGQLVLALRLVNAVARHAAHVPVVVLAAGPEHVLAPVVARRADLARLLRLHLAGVANQ